ncbi:hypothetical protein G6F47_013024 [Rhizopus delemar]|nr:hypothetical protein G6F47_013024 [Rhizopus delemar]
MVFQAITFLKQDKSVREMEELTGLSKSTVRRLRKTHCSSVMRPNGGRSKVLSAADEHYYVRQLTKNCVPSAVKVTKCLENDIGKNVGVETAHKSLLKTVLGAIEKSKKPLLSAKNIRNKLSWCTMPHKTLQVFWFFSFSACHRVLSTAIGSMPYLI